MQDADSTQETTEEAQEQGGRWFFLPDPSWEPEGDDEQPPPELIVGSWFVTADGVSGPFQGNPAYAPPSPASPTDPVDAAIRLAIEEDPPASEPVLNALPSVVLGIALDDEGNALVASLPDEVQAVLVTTAPVNRGYIDVPGWQEAMLWQIAEALPEGVDMVVNPGAPVSMRLQRGTALAAGVRPEGFEPAGAKPADTAPGAAEPTGAEPDGNDVTETAVAEDRPST
ncbi:type VII secretion system-associated protein [Saccharopolyspora shandongensis]|uniref:type VII secretion system-associated protein n=1 Tax=Saccharopolyspora shandongensis TaxID=418495 RepID=UPI00342139B0